MKRVLLLTLFITEIISVPSKNGKKTTKRNIQKNPSPTKFPQSYKLKKAERQAKKAGKPILTKKDLKLEKSNRLQAKMALRYEKALRKSVKMERKLMKKQNQRSIYPTMAKQVDFSLTSPAPYLQVH